MKLLLLLSTALAATVTALAGAPEQPNKHFLVSHPALDLHEVSTDRTYSHSHHVDGVHVEYAAKTRPEHVSLLHAAGLRQMHCHGSSSGGKGMSLVLQFHTAAAATDFLATSSLVAGTTLVSGACKRNNSPVYGRVVADVLRQEGGATGSATLKVAVERVELRDLFESLRAEITVGGAAAAHHPRGPERQRRALRGDSSSQGAPESNVQLGVEGPAYYSAASEPAAVQQNFANSMDANTRNGVRGADFQKGYSFGDAFSFNYDRATKKAAKSDLKLGGLNWATCKDCFVHIGDAAVNVEFKFHDNVFEGPERFGAWVSGKLAANLEVAVESPALFQPWKQFGSKPVVMVPETRVAAFNHAIGPVAVQWSVFVELLSQVTVAKPIPKGALGLRGGFRLDAALKAGVEWTKSNGWQPVKEFKQTFSAYPAAYALPNLAEANSISAKLMPKVTLRLFDAIPIVFTPAPSLGYDFGGATNGCPGKDGYSQWTELDMGVGVEDIKFPDKNGFTLIGGFARDFKIRPKTATAHDALFGPLVCGKGQPNFCSGCLAQFADKFKTTNLFADTCKNFANGGCESSQVAAAATKMGLSGKTTEDIQQGRVNSGGNGNGNGNISLSVAAGAAVGVVAVALVVGGAFFASRRNNSNNKAPATKCGRATSSREREARAWTWCTTGPPRVAASGSGKRSLFSAAKNSGGKKKGKPRAPTPPQKKRKPRAPPPPPRPRPLSQA